MDDKTRTSRSRLNDVSDEEYSSSRRRSEKPSRYRSESVDGDYGRRRRRSKDRTNRRDDDEERDDRRRSRHRRERSRDEHYSTDSRRERSHRHRARSGSRDRQSRSPPRKRRRSRSYSPAKKSRAPLPSQDESFRGELAPGEKPPEKQKPNFKPTGLLAKEANTVAGTTTVLKYHEPAEARKPPPKEQWRMFIFKGKDLLDTIYLHQRSAWLMGRDQKVTDLLLEHPSISKQHAVIQFRHITTTNEYGDKLSKVKPYLIDLESKKGTKLNGKQVEASRFVELVDQDVVSFGDSEREYVLMLPSAGK